ncbi:hypothetical protein AAFF_G00003260 [Aldrovandia affinis]|uniref:Uncharacterized protein n=1 Tax=Aldrovandia affinis TaxID=143900 RepID=A0AAD7X3A1_9TELE|nr:hypothetical protein AAFF_G00003260 [Aldrovandia affinis]
MCQDLPCIAMAIRSLLPWRGDGEGLPQNSGIKGTAARFASHPEPQPSAHTPPFQHPPLEVLENVNRTTLAKLSQGSSWVNLSRAACLYQAPPVEGTVYSSIGHMQPA